MSLSRRRPSSNGHPLTDYAPLIIRSCGCRLRFLEKPRVIEPQRPNRQVQRLCAHETEARSLEGARHLRGRRDVDVFDPLEADHAKADLHHPVYRRHTEKEAAPWLECAGDLGEGTLVVGELLEHREAHSEIEE